MEESPKDTRVSQFGPQTRMFRTLQDQFTGVRVFGIGSSSDPIQFSPEAAEQQLRYYSGDSAQDSDPGIISGLSASAVTRRDLWSFAQGEGGESCDRGLTERITNIIGGNNRGTIRTLIGETTSRQ